jgi:GTP-binding protein LepA
MNYEDIGYRPGRLVRLDIRINGDLAPPMTSVKHIDKAEEAGRAICEKLKDILPRHQFKVAIQACIGSRCIASCHINPVMKDVLAKMSGGDYSRKKKLLEKQKRGKQRLKAFGRVSLPQEAFMAVIKKN